MSRREMADNIKLAQKGDANAFEAILEPIRPFVYAVAYRNVGPSDVDDVVMETFVKAWRSFPSYNGHSSLKTWIYRIAYNTSIDFLRRRQRFQAVFVPERPESQNEIKDIVDERVDSPSEGLLRSEISNLVQQAMARLDKNHSTALWLRYADGLSYKEIAAATGVGIGTVMSRLFNGKRKLIKIIREIEK